MKQAQNFHPLDLQRHCTSKLGASQPSPLLGGEGQGEGGLPDSNRPVPLRRSFSARPGVKPLGHHANPVPGPRASQPLAAFATTLREQPYASSLFPLLGGEGQGEGGLPNSNRPAPLRRRFFASAGVKPSDRPANPVAGIRKSRPVAGFATALLEQPYAQSLFPLLGERARVRAGFPPSNCLVALRQVYGRRKRVKQSFAKNPPLPLVP